MIDKKIKLYNSGRFYCAIVLLHTILAVYICSVDSFAYATIDATTQWYAFCAIALFGFASAISKAYFIMPDSSEVARWKIILLYVGSFILDISVIAKSFVGTLYFLIPCIIGCAVYIIAFVLVKVDTKCILQKEVAMTKQEYISIQRNPKIKKVTSLTVVISLTGIITSIVGAEIAAISGKATGICVGVIANLIFFVTAIIVCRTYVKDRKTSIMFTILLILLFGTTSWVLAMLSINELTIIRGLANLLSITTPCFYIINKYYYNAIVELTIDKPNVAHKNE